MIAKVNENENKKREAVPFLSKDKRVGINFLDEMKDY